MLGDAFDLPSTMLNQQIFNASSSNAWQVWEKPRGCSMVNMFVLGAGAGGGNGANANTGGGGGGGSGALVRGTFPAVLLPNRIYVRPGLGGAANTAGARSYVSINSTGATPIAADLILIS
jgi:hypothetical protein